MKKNKLVIGTDFLVFTMMVYVIFLIINVITSVINGIPGVGFFVCTLLRYILYICLLFSFCYSIIRLTSRMFYFLLLVFLLVSFSYLSYSTIPVRVTSYLNTLLFVCIPLSVSAFLFDDTQIISALAKVGIFASISYAICLIGLVAKIMSMNLYDTAIVYCAILPEVCLMSTIKNKTGYNKVISIIAIIIYVVFTFLFGSRGPLVILVCFGMYEFLYMQRQCSSLKKVMMMFFVFFILCFLILKVDVMLLFLSTFLKKRGINSRTLSILMSDISHTSGRDEIYSLILNEISISPFKIRGMASDTLIIIGGQYTHNLFLELLYEFGVIFGGIFCIYIIISFIISIMFFKYETEPFQTILAIIAVIMLMFSSTFWTNYLFWIWIAKRFSNQKIINHSNIIIY